MRRYYIEYDRESPPAEGDVIVFGQGGEYEIKALAHNKLSDIQGGSDMVSPHERYHLTQAQHTIATQSANDSRSGFMTSGAQNIGGKKDFKGGLKTKKAEFHPRTVHSPTASVVPINWDDGNFQAINLPDSQHIWINMSNPGDVGRYELVIKRHTDPANVGNIVFGDGTNFTDVVWPYGANLSNQGLPAQSILITLRWDGAQYIAISTPWYGVPETHVTISFVISYQGSPLDGGLAEFDGDYLQTDMQGRVSFVVEKSQTYTLRVWENVGDPLPIYDDTVSVGVNAEIITLDIT